MVPVSVTSTSAAHDVAGGAVVNVPVAVARAPEANGTSIVKPPPTQSSVYPAVPDTRSISPYAVPVAWQPTAGPKTLAQAADSQVPQNSPSTRQGPAQANEPVGTYPPQPRQEAASRSVNGAAVVAAPAGGTPFATTAAVVSRARVRGGA
jgi:hypothetical protein